MSFTLVNKKTGKAMTFTRKSETPPFPGYTAPSKTNGLQLVRASLKRNLAQAATRYPRRRTTIV